MGVTDDLIFKPHSPFSIWFDFDTTLPNAQSWKVPRSWAHFDINPDNFDFHYQRVSNNFSQQLDEIHSAEDGGKVLQTWSSNVEAAVDKCLRVQHQVGPLRYPQPNVYHCHIKQ